MKVLVAVASRHGGTWEIGERVADVLRSRGHSVELPEPRTSSTRRATTPSSSVPPCTRATGSPRPARSRRVSSAAASRSSSGCSPRALPPSPQPRRTRRTSSPGWGPRCALAATAASADASTSRRCRSPSGRSSRALARAPVTTATSRSSSSGRSRSRTPSSCSPPADGRRQLPDRWRTADSSRTPARPSAHAPGRPSVHDVAPPNSVGRPAGRRPADPDALSVRSHVVGSAVPQRLAHARCDDRLVPHESAMSPAAPYDALLLFSFGGPDGPDDVLPFLRNVTAGKGIPDERLAEVAEHYHHFGGAQPDQRAEPRAAAPRSRPSSPRRGLDLPVVWGNRNWEPVHARRARSSARRPVPGASSPSSRARTPRTRAAASTARTSGPSLDELAPTGAPRRAPARRQGPGVLQPPRLRRRRTSTPSSRPTRARTPAAARPRLVFVTHSIPDTMEEASAVRRRLVPEQHLDVAAPVAAAAASGSGARSSGTSRYCSRSGPPSQPWLEPDVNDHLDGARRPRGRPPSCSRPSASSPTTWRSSTTSTPRRSRRPRARHDRGACRLRRHARAVRPRSGRPAPRACRASSARDEAGQPPAEPATVGALPACRVRVRARAAAAAARRSRTPASPPPAPVDPPSLTPRAPAARPERRTARATDAPTPRRSTRRSATRCGRSSRRTSRCPPTHDDTRRAGRATADARRRAGRRPRRARLVRRRRPARRRRPHGLVARRDRRAGPGRLPPAARAARSAAHLHARVVGRRACTVRRSSTVGTCPAFLAGEDRGRLPVRVPVRPLVRVVRAARRGAARACSTSTGTPRATTPTCAPTPSRSFALGDYEWLLAFEARRAAPDRRPHARAARDEARRHVREEIPFFTGPARRRCAAWAERLPAG